jgi:dienelactone hydrolase
VAENLSITVEAGERCPLLLVRSAGSKPLHPVFVLHGTNGSKFQLLQEGHLQKYARLGFVAIGVDSRHMGERVNPEQRAGNAAYWKACVDAWHGSAETQRFPFIWDAVWDLQRALDWLESFRVDVDTSRVGAVGISLGGMQVWFWAALDERVSAPAPAIGVQNFGFALREDCWHARVGSLQPFFDAVRSSLKFIQRVATQLTAHGMRGCAFWPPRTCLCAGHR